jgi:AcrR family transcriptional regulator
MTRLVRLRVPDRRAHARQHQRAEILGAARRVLAEMGYDAATLRDIIRRTSLRAATVHELFPDKESILRVLVEDTSRRLRMRVRAARDHATSLDGFVGDAYLAFFSFLAEDRVALELLRREPATIRALLQEPTLMASVVELREDLEAAVARGHLPRVDLEYLAAAMAGVAVEVALRMVERDPIDVQGAAAFVTQLFLGGLDRLQAAPRSRRVARSGRRSR